ncbi:PoNe immunity protein domain-containing protein [Propionibacteriaceae bacterium Y1685]
MIGLDAPVDGKPSHAKLWQPWLDVIAADDGDRQNAFVAFVAGYSKGLRGVGRLVPPTEDGYPGRFAFEAAPPVLHYGLDDRAVRDLPDYPQDLIDYGRSLR